MPDWSWVVARPVLRRGTRTSRAVRGLGLLGSIPGGVRALRGVFGVERWQYGAATAPGAGMLASPCGLDARARPDRLLSTGMAVCGAGAVRYRRPPVPGTGGRRGPGTDGTLVISDASEFTSDAVAELGRAWARDPASVDCDLVVLREPNPEVAAARTLVHVDAGSGMPLIPASTAARAAGVLIEGVGLSPRSARLLVAEARADWPAGLLVLAASPGAPADVAALHAAGADLVLCPPSLWRQEGPALASRATVACSPVAPTPGRRPAWQPWRWPAWIWGLLTGLGMIVGGSLAAAIAAGPVVLPYDEAFVGLSREQIAAVNPHLLDFMRHDRLSLSGATAAIGVLYLAAAVFGQRHHAPWGRRVILCSGAVHFASLFLFLGFGYFDPLHGTTTALLFPVFLLAVFRERPPATRPARIDDRPTDDTRRRALLGQLALMVTVLGLYGGGAIVAWVGVHGVFVPADLHFLHDTTRGLTAGNDRLLPLIAHDRAGFGGALAAFSVGVLVLVTRAWQPGARWLWWTLLAAGIVGIGPTIGVHYGIGYEDVLHLGPVYLVVVLVVAALLLSAPWLWSREPVGDPPVDASGVPAGPGAATAREPVSGTASFSP